MLEPLAASVLTSILSVRHAAASQYAPHSSTATAALRTMSRVLPSDFFTPHPRRTKGKERARPDESCRCEDTGIMDGRAPSSSAGPLPLAECFGACTHQRLRRTVGQRMSSPASRGRIPATHRRTLVDDLIQRRHASTQPAKTHASETDPRERLTSLLTGQGTTNIDDAWRAYKSLPATAVMQASVLLTLADKIAAHAMVLADDLDRSKELKLWGARLRHLLEDLDDRIAQDPTLFKRRTWQIHMCSALALLGDFEDAIALARTIHEGSLDPYDRSRIATMFQLFVITLDNYRDAAAVVEFIVDERQMIDFYISRRSVLGRSKRAIVPGLESLQRTISRIITSIKYPAHYLRDVESRPRPWRQRAADLLVGIFADAGCGEQAFAVMKESLRQQIAVSSLEQLRLVRTLAKARAFVLANPLFAALENSLFGKEGVIRRVLLETGLYLFGKQGDTTRTEEYFRLYRNVGGTPSRCIALLLQGYANVGNAPRVAELFKEFFQDAGTTLRPTHIHYTAVIYAYAQRGDHDNVNIWLEKMVQDGLTPDAHVFNIIVETFANRGDIDSIGTVLEQMRASKFPPSHITYTTIISLLARRQDPLAAEAIFKQAISEGVKPDRKMVSAIMNAHVESGSWQGVITVFDYLRTVAHERRLGLSIEVYNTLLKAYVLIGAPFHVVFKLYRRLEKVGIVPDSYTYSLIIQSAVDNGQTRYAEMLYEQFKELSSNWENGYRMNVFILTILMAGYLRTQCPAKARKVYEAMIRSGIEPSSVTFHSILKAYSNEKSATSIQVAQQFLNDLMATPPEQRNWMYTSNTNRTSFDLIYGPLLTVYARQRDTAEVERLLAEIVDQGGDITLGSLTALLDVHRRNGNIEGVMQTWPQVFELGLKESSVDALITDKTKSSELRRQGNILCIPLSIYLDAVSAAGLHSEVPKIWQEMKANGFTFDAHNWNHLAVAMVRAGQPDRAFELVERVILPFRDTMKSMQDDRSRAPATPLLTDAMNVDQPGVMDRAHPHAAERRVSGARQIRKAVRRYEFDSDDEEKRDFVHDLQLLRRVSPMWNAWQPHVATVSLLADTFDHLQSGHTVLPVRAGSAPPPPPTMEEIEERASQAQSMLERIYKNFPRTVDLVLRYAQWRKMNLPSNAEKRTRLD